MTSRYFGKIAIGGLFCVCALFASISAAPPATQPSDTDRTVAQIAQERFELLTKEYDLAVRRYQQGYGSSDRVMECLRRRAAAARDLSDSDKRTATLRDCVKQLKENVVALRQRYNSGITNEEDILRAQDSEMEAELWLAKSLAKSRPAAARR